MSQSTRLVKAQVRITEWTKIFRDRQQSGLSVKEYCTRNNISMDRYYYWLRKAQETAIDQKPQEFAQLIPPKPSNVDHGSSAIIMIGNIRLEIKDNASEDFLRKIIGVLADVK